MDTLNYFIDTTSQGYRISTIIDDERYSQYYIEHTKWEAIEAFTAYLREELETLTDEA